MRVGWQPAMSELLLYFYMPPRCSHALCFTVCCRSVRSCKHLSIRSTLYYCFKLTFTFICFFLNQWIKQTHSCCTPKLFQQLCWFCWSKQNHPETKKKAMKNRSSFGGTGKINLLWLAEAPHFFSSHLTETQLVSVQGSKRANLAVWKPAGRGERCICCAACACIFVWGKLSLITAVAQQAPINWQSSLVSQPNRYM